MSLSRLAAFRKPAAIAISTASLIAGATQVHAYTLVTRDGHVIESTQKPEVKGTQVFLRLPPRNRLAVVQESLIDWQRTLAANPAPQRILIPSNAQMVEGNAPERGHGTIEKTIVGDGSRRSQPGAPEGAAPKPAEPGQAVAQTPASQKSVHDQEALIGLRKQHAEVTALLETLRAQMDAHEKELAELQSRQSAFASDDNPVQRRIREVQDQISAEREKISKLEIRLGDIRSEAVQHGGTID